MTVESSRFDPADRDALLAMARMTVSGIVRTGHTPDPGPPPPNLERAASAFVTLHAGAEIRGCIGSLDPGRPIWDVVHRMAGAAATRDTRFAPLRTEELDHLRVEISVLSPLRKIAGPEEIELGRHGLEVSRGGLRGLLLPQVAAEHGFSRERFLEEACRKAGLPREAWRDAQTAVHVFYAEVFGDP